MKKRCPMCGSKVKKTASFFYCPACTWYEPTKKDEVILEESTIDRQDELKQVMKEGIKQELEVITKQEFEEKLKAQKDKITDVTNVTDEDIDKVLPTLYFAIINKLGNDALDFSDVSSKKAIVVANWIKKNLDIVVEGKLNEAIKKDLTARLFVRLVKRKDSLKVLETIEKRKQKQKDEERYKKETTILDRLQLSEEEVLKLVPALLNRSKRELGYDIFNFETIADPRAKEIAKWIYNQLEFFIEQEMPPETRKELSTRLFIEICKEVKGEEWLKKFS